MIVPKLQQLIPETDSAPEVQDWSTVQRIYRNRRLAAKPGCNEVIAKAPTDESISHMPMLQSRKRSWPSLENPQLHSCLQKVTSASGLTNRYGTRRSCNGLVVSAGAIYKRGTTILECKTSTTTSNHLTGSAGRKHPGSHLLVEYRRWR